MTINERLFSIMEQKNIKQIDLATALNINKSTIATWKSKKINPPTKYLPTICNLLNVSIEYLTTGDNVTPKDDLPKNYYDFAKDLRNMGATDDDLEKLIKFFSVLKNDSN